MQATTTFHSLYQAHAKDIYRFARFLTGSDDAAADVTSETFLRAWVAVSYTHLTLPTIYSV